MAWRRIASILFALLVAIVPISTGLSAHVVDYRPMFDAPGDVAIAMSALLFSLIICDRLILIRSSPVQSSRTGASQAPPIVPRNGGDGIRAKVAIIFAGSLIGWVLAIQWSVKTWELYQAGPTTSLVWFLLVANYVAAFAMVGMTNAALRQVLAL